MVMCIAVHLGECPPRNIECVGCSHGTHRHLCLILGIARKTERSLCPQWRALMVGSDQGTTMICTTIRSGVCLYLIANSTEIT